MGDARLTERQREALETLFDAEVQAGENRNPKLAWIGSREKGVNGTTLEALERRGLARTQWTERPYGRIVGRITSNGLDLVREWRRTAGHPKMRLA